MKTPARLLATLICVSIIVVAASNRAEAEGIRAPGRSTITVSPGSLNFGTQIVGGTSGAQMVTISNVSQSPLSITKIHTESPFSQSNTCGSTLLGGQSCTASVTFAPAVGGSAPGMLMIQVRSQKTVMVNLSGNGEVLTSIQITPAQAAINYGQQLQLTATGVFADGSQQDLTGQVVWQSSDPSIIIVSNDPASPGLAMTASYGVVNMTATYGQNGVVGSGVIAARPLVARFAYVANQNDSTISAYTVDAVSGRWRDNGYYPVGNLRPSSVAVDPYNRFVYAVGPGETSVYGFSINKTSGALSALPATPLVNTGSMQVMIDPWLGLYLYVLYNNGITAFNIDPNTGKLTPINSYPVTDPTSITIDDGGNFLYAVTGGIPFTSVNSFRIDRNSGDLTAAGEGITGAGPASVSVDSTSNCVYVPNSTDGTVSVFGTSSNGSLTEIAGSPFPVGGNPSSVLPLNGLVFMTAPTQNQVLVFKYGSNCALSGFPLLGLAFASQGLNPVTAVSDGTYLYVTNSGSNEIATMAADFTSGNLTYLWSTRTRALPLSLRLGSGIKPVTYTPKFALVNEGFQLEAFAIDANSGELTSTATSYLASINGSQLATDPTGHYAYDLEGGCCTDSYSIDQNSGAATFVSFVQVTGQRMVTEPSGRWLYEIVSPTSSSPQIQTVNGNLTFLANCGLCAAGFVAEFDPTGEFLFRNGGGDGGSTVAIDPNSGLGASSVLDGNVPNGMPSLFDPRGRFFYSTTIDSDWYLFSVDPGNGVLTQFDIVSQDDNPVAVAIDPAGRFLYYAGPLVSGGFGVGGWVIDQKTGELTSKSPSVSLGTLANHVPAYELAVDSSGKFLYLLFHYTDSGSPGATLYGLSIDQNTGALTPLAGSPFPLSAPATANALALTGSVQ